MADKQKSNGKNGAIKCSVESCDYHQDNYCAAEQIKVSPVTSSCGCSEDTMCNTYICSDDHQ